MSNVLKANRTVISHQSSGKVIGIKTLLNENEQLELVNRLEDVSASVHEEAQVEAERLMEEARAAANRIKAEAEQSAARLQKEVEQEKAAWTNERSLYIEEAKQLGYSEGFTEGRTAGEQQFLSMISDAESLLASIKRDYLIKLEEAEEDILSLAIEVAKKILDSEISQNEELFKRIVSSVLKEAKNHLDIKLVVHPAQYHLVYSQLTDLTASTQQNVSIDLYSDHELAEYSCILESSFGKIDASIDSQLAEIKKKLADIVESENGYEA